jgi:hypothetical protein
MILKNVWDICNLFARFFGKLYEDSDDRPDIQYQRVGGRIEFIVFHG